MPGSVTGPSARHLIRSVERAQPTTPRAFRVACMVYLSDVAPHGGGTVVWPGSHRKLEALARSDLDRYAEKNGNFDQVYTGLNTQRG